MRARVNRICRRLEGKFGIPKAGPRGMSLAALMVHTIISQNTTDKNRDRAYNALRAEFATDADLQKAARAEIESAIRVAGLAGQKSAAIVNFFKWMKKNSGGRRLRFPPEAGNEEIIESLCSINGVGLKTASIVLCFGLGRDVFPVDTHVNRTCTRLGLVPEKSSPDRTHRLMAELVPKGKALSFHLNLIRLGKTICHARNPKCAECPLKRLCPHRRRG